MARRTQKPFERTLDLASVVASQVRGYEKGQNPATRTFQAIRIAVNDELGDLSAVLEAVLVLLKPQGRLAVISFHSLEDRIVKQFIRRQEKGPEIPHGLPLTEAQLAGNRTLRSVGKAMKPSEEEIAANPRSRSSMLRVAQRLEEA